MPRNIRLGKFLTTLTIIGLASATVACTEQDPPLPAPPLPTDRSDANSGNPASPNCYPDINHCASYSSGNITKTNPTQAPKQK
jgi:hypothetical protein